MQRRTAVLAILAFAALSGGPAAGQATPAAKERVVVQVSTPE